MADLVYIDETGSAGKGAKNQPNLILVAVVVDEVRVKTLGERMREIAAAHLGEGRRGFEWHGVEVWNRHGAWSGKNPPELLTAFEEVIGLLEELDVWVGHSTIHKDRLRSKYGDSMSEDAYLLALQYLVEKIDSCHSSEQRLRILIADEAKQHQLKAINMVTDMQEIGSGRVLGRWQKSPLTSVIDSMHFVDSARSPGVQLADMVAFILHRAELPTQGHPDADAAVNRMSQAIWGSTRTWRQTWPAEQ